MCLFFETLKVQNGYIYNIDEHNRRLNNTIESNFHKNSTIDLRDYIKIPLDDKLYRCKIFYDTDIKDIKFYEYKQKKIKSFKIIVSNIKYDYKFLDRSDIDKLYLQKEDCDDILIVDKSGRLKDTSIANIALKINGLWFTPKYPLLYGTVRKKMIDEKSIIPKDLFIKDIKKAESFAILNAMLDFKIIQDYTLITICEKKY